MKFRNANILITGGASGIGRIMGRMALEKEAYQDAVRRCLLPALCFLT